eukprot:gene27312-27060_t
MAAPAGGGGRFLRLLATHGGQGAGTMIKHWGDAAAGLRWPALLCEGAGGGGGGMRQWVHLVGIVRFDLRRGQVLEWVVPAAPRPSPAFLSDVAFLSMPDANTATGARSLAISLACDAGGGDA